MLIVLATSTLLAAGQPAGVGGSSSVLVVPPVALPGADGMLPAPHVLEQLSGQLRRAIGRAGLREVDPFVAAAPKPAVLPADLAPLDQSARAAMLEMDFDKAVRQLNQLQESLRSRLIAVGGVAPLVSAHLALASAYLAMGQPSFADGELAKAACLAPALELEPRHHPPNLIAAFSQTRMRVLAEPQAMLRIEGLAGAEITLDGVVVGETPATVRAMKGLHLLGLGKPGHRPLARVIEVVAGSQAKIDVALEPLRAWTLREQLLAEARGQGRRPQGLELARALATAAGAQVTLVTALLRTSEGYALTATLAGERVCSAVGAISAALTDAESVVNSVIGRLAPGGCGAEVEVLAVDRRAVAGLRGLAIDFGKHLLGIGPAAATQVIAAAKPPPAATAPSPPEAQEAGIVASPWLWGGVGALVLGAVVAGVLLYDPEAPPAPPDRLALEAEPLP